MPEPIIACGCTRKFLAWIISWSLWTWVWHPSFYLDFSKDFYLTWGEWFKFFLEEHSHSQIFFLMAKVLFGFTQDLPLVLEVLTFHLDSRQNVFFSFGRITSENLFEFCTMAFGSTRKFLAWIILWSLWAWVAVHRRITRYPRISKNTGNH